MDSPHRPPHRNGAFPHGVTVENAPTRLRAYAPMRGLWGRSRGTSEPLKAILLGGLPADRVPRAAGEAGGGEVRGAASLTGVLVAGQVLDPAGRGSSDFTAGVARRGPSR
jgi:hypothetical protein